MGNAFAKSKKKGKKDQKTKTAPLPPLEFYKTSSEDWVFGKEHVEAICDSLQAISLQMMEEIIFEYLGKTKDAKQQFNFVKWNHPNYTTFIHIKNTPLDDEFKSSHGNCTEYKVMLMGAGGVGKSSLTRHFCMGYFIQEYDSNIEDTYCRELALDGGRDQVLLDILDTHHAEEFPSLRDAWIREADIFLLVFSVDSEQSFEEVQMIREKILRCREQDYYPVIAVGNKCDLRESAYGGPSTRNVNMDNVYGWCKTNQIPYIETSAKDGRNVDFLFRQSVYEYRMWFEQQEQ